MGTPDFAVETLEKIIENGYEVAAVVTQPDKPKGRGSTKVFSPVKTCALKHNLTVLQPQRAKDEQFVQKVSDLNPDVIVVVAFGQFLPASIIHMPKYGCVNVHASLLPKYRGASPIQWAVIDGCEQSGVTTMLMDEGVDTGDILMTKVYKLSKKETGGSLFEQLSHIGAELLIDTLKGLEAGSIKPVKQDDTKSSYVKMLSKSMGQIDFTKTAVEIERLIRGLNPWPSAYTYLHGKMLKIWDAEVIKCLEAAEENVSAGTVITAKERLFVKCGDGFLDLKEVQLEGKKRMKIEAFLRGNAVENGIILG